jgi:uncharacterized membrane protein
MYSGFFSSLLLCRFFWLWVFFFVLLSGLITIVKERKRVVVIVQIAVPLIVPGSLSPKIFLIISRERWKKNPMANYLIADIVAAAQLISQYN